MILYTYSIILILSLLRGPIIFGLSPLHFPKIERKNALSFVPIVTQAY